jgi:hypothetical protein
MFWTRLLRATGTRAPATRTARRNTSLRVELLEDRSVPASTAINAVAGTTPTTFASTTPSTVASITPITTAGTTTGTADSTFAFTANAFGGGSFNPFPGFTGQVEYASGDVTGDGVADIIAAEGPGARSQSEVRVFDGASAQKGQAMLIADFFPYSNGPGASQTPGFAGGTYVAVADLLGTGTGTGTGADQLVTSTGAGGQGNVKVFDFQNPTTGQFLGSNPTLLSSFIVYPGYQGDVPVAAVSAGAGTQGLIITASGAGTTNSDVRVFTGGATIGQVPVGTAVPAAEQTFAFPGYLGGVQLAAGGTSTAPQLYLEPNTGTSVVSTYALTSPLGGVALTPGVTFTAGTGTPTQNFLASADVNNTGTLDLLTSSYGIGGSTPISAYSFGGGFASPVTLPTGFQTFQGFGFFGNSFLNSSVFTPLAAVTGTTTGLAGTSATGITGTTTGTNPLTGTTATGSGTTSTGAGTGTLSPSLNNGLTTGTGTGTGVNTGLGGTNSTPAQSSLAATGPTSSVRNTGVA